MYIKIIAKLLFSKLNITIDYGGKIKSINKEKCEVLVKTLRKGHKGIIYFL